MKTIGTPAAAAKPEIVPSLFVLNSRGATQQGDTARASLASPPSFRARLAHHAIECFLQFGC